MYKYNELQVSNATQKLSCKANCKTPFLFHSAKCFTRFVLRRYNEKFKNMFQQSIIIVNEKCS